MKAAKSGGGAIYYNCSSHKESGGGRCDNHYISEGVMHAAITQGIGRSLADGFLSGRCKERIADHEKHLAKNDADMHQLSVKQDDLTKALMDAYEAYLSHRIAKDELKKQIYLTTPKVSHCGK